MDSHPNHFLHSCNLFNRHHEVHCGNPACRRPGRLCFWGPVVCETSVGVVFSFSLLWKLLNTTFLLSTHPTMTTPRSIRIVPGSIYLQRIVLMTGPLSSSSGRTIAERHHSKTRGTRISPPWRIVCRWLRTLGVTAIGRSTTSKRCGKLPNISPASSGPTWKASTRKLRSATRTFAIWFSHRTVPAGRSGRRHWQNDLRWRAHGPLGDQEQHGSIEH